MPASRAARGATWVAVGIAAALSAFGCGGSATPSDAQPVASPQPVPPTPPSGPCDQGHQDQALAIAQRLLRERMRGCAFGTATAAFSIRYAQPQALGKPAPSPLYGWTVEIPLLAIDTTEVDPQNADIQRLVARDPSVLTAPPVTGNVVRVTAPNTRMPDSTDTANPALASEPTTGFAPIVSHPDGPNQGLAPLPGTPVDPAHQDIPVPVDQVNTNLQPSRTNPNEFDVRRLGATVAVFVAVDGRASLL